MTGQLRNGTNGGEKAIIEGGEYRREPCLECAYYQ